MLLIKCVQSGKSRVTQHEMPVQRYETGSFLSALSESTIVSGVYSCTTHGDLYSKHRTWCRGLVSVVETL